MQRNNNEMIVYSFWNQLFIYWLKHTNVNLAKNWIEAIF